MTFNKGKKKKNKKNFCLCFLALLTRVKEEDQKLLKFLLPRARSLAHHCAQGLSYGPQVKTAISYW